MPATTGIFAFQTAADGYQGVSDNLDLLHLHPVDGSGKTVEALNALREHINQVTSGWQTMCGEVKDASDAQHGADKELAKSPTNAQLNDLRDKASKAEGEARANATKAAADAQKEAKEAREKHRQDTEPHKSSLENIDVPESDFFAGAGGLQHAVPNFSAPTTVPGSIPAPSTATPAPEAAPTHLSSDLDSDGKGRAMLGNQPPQMPPMQPQAQGQGAPPGAGGAGIPAGGNMLGTTQPRRNDDKKYQDPLTALATETSGAAGLAAGSALGSTTTERGNTASGIHTKADTTGVNSPAVGGNGTKPGAAPSGSQGGAGMRGMNAMPFGSGAGMGGGTTKGKERPFIQSSDKNQYGFSSREESVEGGLIGRDTAQPPKFPYRNDDGKRK